MKKTAQKRFLSAFLALALVLSSFVWIPPVEVKALAPPASLDGLIFETDFHKQIKNTCGIEYIEFTGDTSGTFTIFCDYDLNTKYSFAFTYDPSTGELVFPEVNGDLKIGETTVYTLKYNEGRHTFRGNTFIIVFSSAELEKKYVQHSHSESWKTVAEPTYTSEGLKEKTCDACGKVLETESIPKLTHTAHSGTWTTIKQPTVSATGTKQRICSVCGAKETAPIAKLTPPAPAQPVVRTDISFTVSAKAKNNNVTLKWGTVPGAASYTVYYALGNGKSAYTQAGVTRGNSLTIKNLNQKASYQVYVRANMANNAIANSYVSHVAMPKYNRTNPKSLKLKFTKATLKVGKSKAIKATVVKESKKKKFLGHVAKLRYYSTNTKVATVSKAGRIKAVAKGKANIVVITENGLTKTVKVTVK